MILATQLQVIRQFGQSYLYYQGLYKKIKQSLKLLKYIKFILHLALAVNLDYLLVSIRYFYLIRLPKIIQYFQNYRYRITPNGPPPIFTREIKGVKIKIGDGFSLGCQGKLSK